MNKSHTTAPQLSRIKLTIKETLNNDLFSEKNLYFIVKSIDDKYRYIETDEMTFADTDIHIDEGSSETLTDFNADKDIIFKTSQFKQNQMFNKQEISTLLNRQPMSKDITYFEIDIELFNKKLDIIQNYSYTFSTLSCDFCYEDLDQYLRFFIYQEFIEHTPKIITSYLDRIAKPVKHKSAKDKDNSIGSLLISPPSFFYFLICANKIKPQSLLEHVINNDGDNCTNLTLNKTCKRELFHTNESLPQLHSVYYVEKVGNKYISNFNLIEFENCIATDTLIELPSDLKNYTVLDSFEIIEHEHVFYAVPWVKLERV